MWRSLWFRVKILKLLWAFIFKVHFWSEAPPKPPRPADIFQTAGVFDPEKTKLLFKFTLKQSECCGELMSLNESSECCDQRTPSPCCVNYISVQWSTCSWTLVNLPFNVSRFNVANTGRSDLNCSGSLVSEEFGLKPSGAENTSFIFRQPIKRQKITDRNIYPSYHRRCLFL